MEIKEERNAQGQTEKQFLASYDASKFDRPSVSVDMLVFTVANEDTSNYRKLPVKKLRILMVKRGNHPYIGQWALPGGFVEASESLEDAARRELKEETNIDNIYLEQLYTWGELQRDPRTRVISVSYLSLVNSAELRVEAADDATDAQWFTVEAELQHEQQMKNKSGNQLERIFQLKLHNAQLCLTATIREVRILQERIIKSTFLVTESQGIAFDHAKIIFYGINRLRNKVKYTDIAFNLMPKLFTLTELQQVYEIILGRELVKANFRRKIAHLVTETDKKTQNKGHRPSKLYGFKQKWSDELNR